MNVPEQRRPWIAEWLAAPMRRQRATYLRVALAAAMINLFGLATSMFSMTVYDRVVPHEALASLVALSIGLVVVCLFDFVLRILRAQFVDLAGAEIDREVGGAVFARLMAMRLDARRGSAGALASVVREIESLREMFASASLVTLVDVPFALLSLGVIALVGGWLVLVPLVAVVLVVPVGLFVQPAMDRLSRGTLIQGVAKQSVLVEALGAIETVKTSGDAPMLAARWNIATDAQATSACRQRMVSTIAVTVASTVSTLAYSGTIIAGVFLVAAHDLTTGALVACSMLSSRAIAPFGQIASMLSRLSGTRAAYRQLDAVMSQPGEARPAGLRPRRVDGAIQFRDVSFGYPAADGEPGPRAIDRLNLEIAPGERVALLGRVGSGKSTLAHLAAGLYTPQEGQVLIDGCDLRQYDLDALRAHFGIALQDGALFSGSVRENILLGRTHLDDEAMIHAATLSGSHSFMGSLANGYDLRLADRGAGLSGGQRQSIALARALAHDARILVFDEPTSGMDAETEAQLISRLQAHVEGRTMLMVTHRPALLHLATRIVVMAGGRIVEDGPRADVLRKITRKAA